MRPQTREVLDYLDVVLMRGDRTAREVWNVLTALRGPDIRDVPSLKMYTTVPIRAAAFPRTAAAAAPPHMHINGAHINGAQMRGEQRFTLPAGSGGYHFHSHTRDAAYVLGFPLDLIWGAP